MSRGEVAGLVLAAGSSSRMGPDLNKLSAVVDGKPLVAGPVDVMRDAGIDPVYVVTGYQGDVVRTALAERRCVFIEHPDWAAGMGASIAAGVRGLLARAEPKGIMICVGDLAGLRAEWLVALIEAFRVADSTDCLCVPMHRGRPGHPVLFGSAYFEALMDLEGDRGGRAILEAHVDRIREVEIESDAILRDLDTPSQLEAWRLRN